MWHLIRLVVVVLFFMGKLPHPGVVLLELLDVGHPPLPTLDSPSVIINIVNFIHLSIHYLSGMGLYLCGLLIAAVLHYQLFCSKQVEDKTSDNLKGTP